jgi:hypothetical protein
MYATFGRYAIDNNLTKAKWLKISITKIVSGP